MQGSLRASSTFLLLLLVAGTKTGEVPDDNYNQESSDVRNNLIDPHEEDPVGTSRSSLGLSTYRSSKEVIPVENSSAVSKKPQARTLSIPSFLGGEKETEDNQAASTSAIGEIAPLNDHPLWKVHKYQGIDLTPVALPTAYEPPSESYGPPAETYGPNEPRSPTESYGPPKDTYGPPESSGSTAGDSSAALSALDNLSGLTSILPEDGSSITSPLSSISSLASLLTQKPNSVSSTAGLSFEQLSALASLVSLLHAKSNGAPASTYGPPSLPSNIRGTELSSLASLVNLFPTETASSSGSLLTRLRSFLTRRPAILTSLLNALNLNSPSKPKGAFPRFLESNIVYPLSTTKDISNFASPYNTVAKFSGNAAKSDIGIKGKVTKHVVLGKFLSKSGKLDKLGVINSHPLFKFNTALKGHAISNIGKLGKLKVIKNKLPWKVVAASKPALLKAVSDLGKLGKHRIIKGHFPLKLHLVKKLVFGKKHSPLKAAIFSIPFKVKKHFFSKFKKFSKIGIPLKLSVLGKSIGLKGHILSKLIKLGILKSYIPLKVLGKHAAIKLIKFNTGVKRIKYGILVAPFSAKKHIISKLKTLGKAIENIRSSLPSKYDVLTAPLKLKYNLISKLKSGGDLKHSSLKWGLLSKIPGLKGVAEFKETKFGHSLFSKSGDSKKAEASRKDDQIEKGKPIRGNDGYILNHIPNSFLGTAPEAGVANLLDLPNLPPISIPSNYKFQETGVGRPYVLKYSKPGPSTVPDNTYGPPPQDAVPIYEVPQHQQGEPVYPSLNTASTYGISVPVSLTYGPSQDATSFQPSHSLSQEPFNSFHSPMVSYPSSIQEPRSPINSYGQPTSPYAAVSSETNYANSGFQTEYQNQFYNHAALTPAADTSASQSTYSLPQQHNIQSQLDGTSLEYASYQSEQTGPYSHHIYPTSHSGPFPDTSRSDTDVPSDDTPSKHRSDFLPSTLAAATGAGYSRVVFQRSQPETPPHDHEPARQAESEFDLLATSTSDVAQSTGSSTSSADESALSPKDSQLHKGNGLHRETNEFLMG